MCGEGGGGGVERRGKERRRRGGEERGGGGENVGAGKVTGTSRKGLPPRVSSISLGLV